MNVIAKARIKLLQKQPFFGRLALLLDVRRADYIPTLCTDGEKLLYNEDYVKGLNEEQRQSVVLHEVLHVALGHLWRRGDRLPHIWNLAADYVVNDLLVKNSLPVPQGGLYSQEYAGMNAEMVYEKLKKNAKTLACGFHMQIDMNGGGQGDQEGEEGEEEDKKKGKGGGGKGKDQKDDKKKKGKGGQGDDQQDDQQDQDDKGKGKGKGKDQKPNGCPVCQSHGMWDKLKTNPKKAKKIQQKFEGTMEQIARDKGSVPAGFERIIEALKPQEDWRKILMNYLSSSKNDYDFMRRDRRTLDWDFYLPDLRDETTLDNLVVAIDTSGSIGVEELNVFVSEIKEILNLFPKTKGWLIDCDAEVHQCIEIEKAKEPTLKFYGGGGTSHKPVFKEIKDKNLKPKVLLAFTDLYTDFPSTKPDYPVLWLATPGSGKMNVPFGRVIELKEHLQKRR